MNNYLTIKQQIEEDVAENHLRIVEGWSDAELARIFALDSDDEVIGHAKQKRVGDNGPFNFLLGEMYYNHH